MRFMNKKESRGFTLLELLLVLGVVGIISTFAISIAGSVRNMSNVSETKNRMIEIAAKAKQYYRGHESLPSPEGVTTNATDATPYDDANGKVPVQAANFDLEQKYRLDSWGQYFSYIIFGQEIDTTNGINDTDLLDIDHLVVNGKNVAGVIISNGPDQIPDTINAGQDLFPSGSPDGITETYTLAGDDIVVPINVSNEAMEIALDELKVLQDKVNAFDALYEGVDNNGVNPIDEDNCDAATGVDDRLDICIGAPGNDPNCGRATLDYIATVSPGKNCTLGGSTVTYYGDDQVDDFIIALYSLSITLDPWLNSYRWSNADKFYSGGPDGTAPSADDIYP